MTPRIQTKGRRRMSKRELLPVMQSLKDVKDHERRSALLTHFDERTCEALYEMVHNILNSKLLPAHTARKLSATLAPHKKTMTNLANPNYSGALKKRHLKTIGGNPLLAILAAAIPLVTQLLTRRGKR